MRIYNKRSIISQISNRGGARVVVVNQSPDDDPINKNWIQKLKKEKKNR